MKIFLTGGTGFIGKRMLNALSGNIVLLSRKKNRNYKTVVCDLQKERIPEDALAGVDVVYHIAGFAHDFRDSNKAEHIYRKVNVDSTVELAEMAIKNGVKQFVFVSSVKAGEVSDGKVPENLKVSSKIEGIYGKSKREAEIKLLEITNNSNMHVAIVRPSLVYGPGVKGNLKMMLSGIERGWFPPLPDTSNRRSMVHVDDLVRAILLVSEDERADRQIFVVTDGVPHSSCEIYEAMCFALGKSIPKRRVPLSVFNLMSLISPKLRHKVDKLLGDEWFSSASLEALGFKANKSLSDMNKTDF